jgi:hypothetical protein
MKIYEEEEQQSKTVEHRKWFRKKCDIETHCEALQDKWPCKVVDVSEDGLGIVSACNLSTGDVISIHDPMAVAEVVWAEGNRAGLKIKK